MLLPVGDGSIVPTNAFAANGLVTPSSLASARAGDASAVDLDDLESGVPAARGDLDDVADVPADQRRAQRRRR